MTTEFDKATPRPWTAEDKGGKGAWIKGANEDWSALSCGISDETADANAALIVAAVNAFGSGQGDAVAWQTMENCPSDGRMIWVRGGKFPEPEVREADGEWWRDSIRRDVHAAPFEWAQCLPPGAAHPPAASARIVDLQIEVSEQIEARALLQLSLNEARGRTAELEAALQEISDAHLPDQPAVHGDSEFHWAVRHISRLRGIARAALSNT